MRLRFSLRLLLLLIVAASALFYLWFVRPKVVAQRFVAAMEAKDFARAESLCTETGYNFLTHRFANPEITDVKVKTLPRRWSDISTGRQLMFLQIIPNKPRPGTNIFVGCRVDIVATSFGLEPPKVYFVRFAK